MKPLSLALSCAGGITWAAVAQAQVEVETRVSSRSVSAGQRFQVQLQLKSSSGGEPSAPSLPVPPGVQVQGPALGRQSEVSITNGRVVQHSGVTATWTLSASRPGTYRIGPPSLQLGGQRHVGQPVVMDVTPGAGSPSPRSGIPGRIPFDPFQFFDPFGGSSPFGRMPLDEPEEERVPEFPAELAVERAPDATAFVVARAKPERVVLGQAVRFSVYAYGARGVFDGGGTEPSREGFLAYNVEQEPARAYQVPIDGRIWLGSKISEMVLFPIRTGSLRIGAMRFSFRGRGYPASNASGLVRESTPLDIVVVEPPLSGRPPGYRLGDVGSYTLSATVEPRKLRQGEAVAVIAKLEGVGNVPPKLNVPQQTGVEWLEPTSVEKVEALAGVVRGSRTFTYVVKLDRPGNIDLGELNLPFYDAERRRYEVARAKLGAVEVAVDTTARAAAPSPTQPEDRLQGLLAPVETLRASPPPASYWADRRIFWMLLLVGPLGVLSASALVRLSQRARQRISNRRARPEQLALRELTHARRAGEDVAATAAAVERALHLAIEAATGLKSRGVLQSELARKLRELGIADELSERSVSLLEASEAARFVQGGSATLADDLRRQATDVVGALQRGRRG